jgi:hypothetical protein
VLISLYRQEPPDITVLALSGPALEFSAPAHPAVVKEKHLALTWTYVGHAPTSYTLKLDGKVVAENLTGEKYDLDLSKISAGKHTIQLTANGVHTYFDLDPTRLTVQSKSPLPVTSEIEIKYEKGQ